MLVRTAWLGLCCGFFAPTLCAADAPAPSFVREVVPVLSRLGCNGGSCHGAVQGQNGFRLSLFGADPAADYVQIARGVAQRRVNPFDPEQSALLLKSAGLIPHGGGRVTKHGSPEYELLRSWIAAGLPLDDVEAGRVADLRVEPAHQAVTEGAEYALRVQATFADGSSADVTHLCTFRSGDMQIASVDEGRVTALGVGDAALIVRFGSQPALARVVVSRTGPANFPEETPGGFIDRHIVAKLRQLNVPPSEQCDDATFLRRVCLDVAGRLPRPEEVRAFLADASPEKRPAKVEELLSEPGYAALWTLKFCDLLGAADFGVYADGIDEHNDAPRFQAWIRARLSENLPYDEFAERIITATSREGRSLDEWAAEVVAQQHGFTTPRTDLDVYAKRKTLDIYWQRRAANGVEGTLQVAHAFLGLRLECAQCHRHPHDVWQQADLLDFANFFTRVRTVGFQGDNEKRYPEQAAKFKELEAAGKQLEADSKQLAQGRGKEAAERAKKVDGEANRLRGEIRSREDRAKELTKQALSRSRQAAEAAGEEAAKLLREAKDLDDQAAKALAEALELEAKRAPLAAIIAEHEALQKEIRDMERRGRALYDSISKRVLHAEIFVRDDEDARKLFAQVTSPLGTKESQTYRLLGESEPVQIAPGSDPRIEVAKWLRRPDNPFFAKAIVNRVWAHYFGRGIIDPPDDLSPLNPPTHPELLDDLCREFIAHGYDLKWLHRTILASQAYQRSSAATSENRADRSNYASFQLRRLPAEVLLDALNTATGTTDDYQMKYWHWPDGINTVGLPYLPSNDFVVFVLEQFGRPARNSAVQCDCERQSEASLLQILTFANHPKIREKIAAPAGRVASLLQSDLERDQQVAELYLAVLGRLPDDAEQSACRNHLGTSDSPEQGLREVMWSLLNTREFLLQH